MGVVFYWPRGWFFLTLPSCTEKRRSGFIFHLQAEPRDATHRFTTAATTQREADRKPLRYLRAQHSRFWNAAKTKPAHSLSLFPFLPPLLAPLPSFLSSFLFSPHTPPSSSLLLSPSAAVCSSRDGTRSTRRFASPLPLSPRSAGIPGGAGRGDAVLFAPPPRAAPRL